MYTILETNSDKWFRMMNLSGTETAEMFLMAVSEDSLPDYNCPYSKDGRKELTYVYLL